MKRLTIAERSSFAALLLALAWGCGGGSAASTEATTPEPTAAAEPTEAAEPVAEESAEPAHHEVHWGYEGEGAPANWGTMKEEYALCGTGKSQSPIDLKDAKKAKLPKLATKYKKSTFKINNNGHTIQVDLPEGSTATLSGKEYNLVQFHFHAPSENTLNGESFPMEMHLVHKNADGELAVIGVFIKEGKAHPVIDAIWPNLPTGETEEPVACEGPIDPAVLLPKKKGYYAFNGSLTTPPCSEGVAWHMLAEPIELSSEQILRFTGYYDNNARPVQPLNERQVQLSK